MKRVIHYLRYGTTDHHKRESFLPQLLRLALLL